MKRYFSLYSGLAFLALGVCAVPKCVWAKIVITEIMYDVSGTDTGREWVEVKNEGDSPVDLSAWKLFEANSNHKIVAIGSPMVSVGSYVVIADSPEKFKVDNSSFTGQIFDSAFSLSGEGESLSMRNEGGVDIDVVAYDPSIGAKGDGLSLQKTSDGRWVAAAPTPGSMTVARDSESLIAQDDEGSGDEYLSGANASQNSQSESAHSGQEIANTEVDSGALEVSSGRTRLGTVDSPLRFSAHTRKLPRSASTSSVDHLWSMGDGSVIYGDVVHHAYRFPGVYSVILNSTVANARAVSRVSVRIIKPDIRVTSVGDWYVELSNQSASEVNVGGWVIETKKGRATIGDDTIIGKNSTLTIPVVLPGLLSPVESVRLVSPLGIVYAEWAPESAGTIMIEMPGGMNEEGLKESILKALKTHE